MNDNVYICSTKKSYEFEKFNVSKLYPELKGIDIEISSDKKIYNDVRNIFIEMKLDEKNIGSRNWNPFKEFISEGNTVLIKPNLVKHINKVGSTDSLITNFSLIRPVIDYTILALNNSGRIIVGDAPVQDCDFEELKKINNLCKNIESYKKLFKDISLIDFRKNQNPNIKCTIVKLNKDSSFAELDDIEKEYSITNYDLELMNKHHSNGIHEYIVPEDVLKADVIINMPKPKTHRKAGMTACMKNFVGINGNKECLPHHRSGGPKSNGDEFPENNLLKNIFSNVSKYTYKNSKFIFFILKCLNILMKIFKLDRFKEGSWYGNDTIWRTILDLNKLVLYADKNGNITNTEQRTIFNIADMVISGEKEGPLLPTDKGVGIIVAGFNQLNNDAIIANIMGFSPEKIKYIKNGYNLKQLKISNTRDFNVYDENGLVVNLNRYNMHFIATNGWKDYLN